MNRDDYDVSGVILLVDDEPSNIRILNQAVASLGKVYFANSGEEALKLMPQILPDIILLDIEMPGMNGYDVCKVIKSDPALKDTAIIFVTAHNDAEYELKALEYGGVDFLQKPINPVVAEARVKTHLILKKEQHQLKLTRSTLHNIIHHLPVFVAYWDENLDNVFSNDAEGSWFGLTSQQMLGASFQHIMTHTPKLDKAAKTALLTAIGQVSLGKTMDFDLTFNAVGSDVLFASVSLVPTLVEGEFSGLVMLMNDITPLKVMQHDLHQDKELLKVTLNSIGDAVIATDVDGLVTFMNPIAESLTGWPNEEAMKQPIETVMPLLDSSGQFPLTNPTYIAIEESRVVGMALNATLHSRDGRKLEVEDSAAPILNEEGNIQGAIIVFHDVSETRAMALKMSHLANHDSLTNLPNRMLLQDRAERALTNAHRKNEKVAMIILDIDNFKNVNDSVGHSIGDRLLQKIGKRLLSNSRGVDTVSRQGGDEFIILLPEIVKMEQVVSYSARIMHLFSEPLWIEQQRFDLSCSIGISVYPDDSADVETLHRHADAAMYRAKQLGRSRWHFFSDEIESNMLNRHQLEQYMRRAVEEGLFEVYYQAKTDARDNSVVGVEALLRLKREDGAMISPADFIPLAEDSGLIVPIGEYVLKQACKDALSWQEMGFNHSVSINISAVQFEQDNFYDMVKMIFTDLSIETDLIEFEITEGVLAKDANRMARILELLKLLGIKISIDDFGTGYSSLSYLKRYPIDILKIDQSFVRDMIGDGSDAAIVDAVISLGKSLQMELVAEGVETIEQANALAAKECFIMQGYYYCKPMPYQDMCAYLNDNSKGSAH